MCLSVLILPVAAAKNIPLHRIAFLGHFYLPQRRRDAEKGPFRIAKLISSFGLFMGFMLFMVKDFVLYLCVSAPLLDTCLKASTQIKFGKAPQAARTQRVPTPEHGNQSAGLGLHRF